MARAGKLKLRDRTPENDIPFAGFLSYQGLRAIGWFLLAISQISVILHMAMSLNKGMVGTLQTWDNVISFFAPMPVVLFMLANFSFIFMRRDNYKKLFIRYGALLAGMYVLANLLVFNFGFGFAAAFGGKLSFWDLSMMFGSLLANMGRVGYSFNAFVDLFLMVLTFYLLDVTPKNKIFGGKRVIFFRLLALLPVAYEFVAVFLKAMMVTQDLVLPTFVFFLLPSKAPFVFFAFVAVGVAIKIARRRYIKKYGHTPEQWQVYVSTNAHTFKVSIMISVLFAVAASLDLFTLFGFLIAAAIQAYNPETQEISESVLNQYVGLADTGFGGAISLIPVIPLVLIYSYRKKPKNPKLDTYIPVIGIGLVALIYIEGLFWTITGNLHAVVAKLQEWLSGGLDMEEEAIAENLHQAARSLLDGVRLLK